MLLNVLAIALLRLAAWGFEVKHEPQDLISLII